MVYQYKDRLFTPVNDEDFFSSNQFAYGKIAGYRDGYMYISSDTSIREISSFFGLRLSSSVLTTYQLKNGRFELAEPYGDVKMDNTYISEQDFVTSANSDKLEIKDGVKVKKGQKIQVTRVLFIENGKIHYPMSPVFDTNIF